MKFNHAAIFVVFSAIAVPAFAGLEYKDLVADLVRNADITKTSIAVLDFSYSDGRDSRDGAVVSERIITELVKSKKCTVVERRELEKVLQELKLEQTGLIDVNSTKSIGRMLGAEQVILGTLTELPEGRLELNTRIVSVASGTVIAAASGEIKKDWLDQYRQRLIEETRNVESNPKDADAFYQRGVTNYDLQEYDKAITDFGIAISLDSVHKGAHLGRAHAYSEKMEYEKAISDFTKVLELAPLSAEACLGRGMAYLFSGNYIKSIEDLSRAIAINPTYESAYINRGVAYTSGKEYFKAIKDFDAVLKLNLKSKHADFSGYLNRAVAYRNLGEYDKALDDCTRVIKIDPKYIDGYLNRARVYIDKHDYQKAIADASLALKLNPKYASAYMVRGDAYGLSDEIDKAIQDFDKAIEINPTYYDYYAHRAQAHINNGALGLGIIDLTNSIARIRIPSNGPGIHPEYAGIISQRGALYFEIKDYDKAIDDFGKALLLNPNDADIFTRRAWAYFKRGDVKIEDYASAISDITSALEIMPGNTDLYVFRGVLHTGLGVYYTKLGRTKEATDENKKTLNDYMTAMQLDPTRRDKLMPDIDRLKTQLGEY